MANQVEQKLFPALFNCFQQEHFVTLATIDFETGGPNVNAISWVYAPDDERIYFSVDNRSRIVENIKANPHAVITIIANESVYSISGRVTLKTEKLPDVPLKLALFELSIKEVRDVMFYGSKIATEPKYVKTYDEKAAAKLDKQVLDAMKKA